jgi:hypothetical protein
MNQISRLAMIAVLAAGSFTANAAGIFSARSIASTFLSPSGGVETTVVQVSVPAGTWTVFAKATFVNWGNKDYDRCHVLADGTQIDGATTMTGELDGMPAAATVANLGVITTFARETFRLNCWHDFGVPNQHIDPDAMLVVSRSPK